jgi:hypothetical protein
MSVEQQVTRARLINKTSIAGRFVDETPAQNAKHREIARRHRRRCNDRAAFIPRLRIAELQRIFVMHYREKRLPDDDAGRADLRLMADHLAQIDPRLIRPWATTWLPTLTSTELDALVEQVGTGKRWKADALARELGLDDAIRTRLKIKTIGAIDCGKAMRKSRRRRKRIAADRARRAKAGARPHAQSAENLMPWIEAGISRATYYRRRAIQKPGLETVETNSRPIDRRSSTAKNRQQKVATAVAQDTPTFPGEPLPLCFRVNGLFDQDGIAEATGLAPVECTLRRLQAVASVVARSPNPERWSHLLVAASGAWARARREAASDGR